MTMTPDIYTISEYKSLKKNKGSKGKDYIESVLKSLGLNYCTEYKFAEGRKFRADFAIVDKKILLEYEGLVFGANQKNTTGKSGHTTATGYSGNCEKYNLMTTLGFHLLRYTALNYKNVSDDLRKLILILQR